MGSAMRITTVGLDADDTLWHNETIFRLTQDRLRGMLADFADHDTTSARLAEVEKRKLRLYGYGVKGFTLSMIETAMELTDGEPPGRQHRARPGRACRRTARQAAGRQPAVGGARRGR